MLLLILLAPVMIVVAAALVACGRKPFFRQTRIGWRQTEFSIFKFQTLVPGRSEGPQRTSWLQRVQRPAFAALSRLLRQSRIDELPQLVNIVKGEMAFIGPRPLIASDVAQMPDGGAKRFAVRPGLTGLAQVSGGQALTPAEKLLLDVQYIEARSRRLGLWILAQTCLVPFEHDQPRAELLRPRCGRLGVSHPADSSAKRAIALVTPYFWPERLGCAPYMTDLAHHLVRQGHAVDVLTAEPHYPRKDRHFAADLRRQDVPAGLKMRRARICDRSSGRLGIRLLNDVLFALQAGAAAADARREWSAVLVLAPSVLAVPTVRLARPRTRLVAAVYEIESVLARAPGLVRNPWLARALDAVERWCLNRADAIVVLTPQMKAALVAIGVARPIDVAPIWPLVEPQPDRSSDKLPRTVMYSGGLTRRHGAHLLAPLWQHLRRRMPHCHLIIQGDGEERDSILRGLTATGGAVTLRASVDRNALASHLAEADLQLVLQAEQAANFTMPSKALTSLAAGVPFLTNAPLGSALADFATASGGGVVVPGAGAADLAAAAATLLGAPQELRAMAARGLAHLRRHHDPARLRQRYDALLLGSPRADIIQEAPALTPEVAEP